MSESLEKTKVVIFGRDYEIKGERDGEYIQNLASYVDSTMQDIAARTKTIPLERVAILAALNIADEMLRERQKFNEYLQMIEYELREAINPTVAK